MTARDTFAAAALTGLISLNRQGPNQQFPTEVCELAFRWADAMLREREKSRAGQNGDDAANCTERDRFAKPMQNEKSAEVLPRPYEICDEKRSFSDTNHDAAPAAKARTDSASCGRGCDGTDKPVTLPAMGTGDLSEAEIDAIEYVVEEGRIASMNDYGILRSLLVRVRPEWETVKSEEVAR